MILKRMVWILGLGFMSRGFRVSQVSEFRVLGPWDWCFQRAPWVQKLEFGV